MRNTLRARATCLLVLGLILSSAAIYAESGSASIAAAELERQRLDDLETVSETMSGRDREGLELRDLRQPEHRGTQSQGLG